MAYTTPLRILELFSGIGGMHRAAELAQNHLKPDLLVVGAVDVNTTANMVYRYNHPATKHLQRNILGLTPDDINKLRPDIILMSPPCQPHTRQGNRKDVQDPRSAALSHILNIFPKLCTVRYVLVENVQGFEVSKARDELIKVLQDCHMTWQEFLVNSTQLGIPNSRLRYYLICKRKEEPWSFSTRDELHTDFSAVQESIKTVFFPYNIRPNIRDYLQPKPGSDYLVADKILQRYANIFDIVTKESNNSCCFTKAYSHYFEGTGSILQQAGDLDKAYADYKRHLEADDREAAAASLHVLGLRFFTPKEVASLLGFPMDFMFPPDSTRKQCYKVLGNSVNVNVVAVLLHALLS